MQTIRTSPHDEFWPSGWMVYACFGLGAFDLSLIGFLVHSIARHAQ